MFTQLSEATSYPVKDFSNKTTATTVSKPGFFRKLAQRNKTKDLEKELKVEGDKKSNNKRFDSLTQPYLEGNYLKAPISRY